MNFRPELLAKVLAGVKTQTRRPAKADHDSIKERSVTLEFMTAGMRYGDICEVRTTSGRTVYKVGKDYAACPGRGKSQLGRIKIVQIRREDVRTISREDVAAEGFQCRHDFFKVWVGFYDPKALNHLLNETDFIRETELDYLNTRPINLYLAWALTFELAPARSGGSERGE